MPISKVTLGTPESLCSISGTLVSGSERFEVVLITMETDGAVVSLAGSQLIPGRKQSLADGAAVQLEVILNEKPAMMTGQIFGSNLFQGEDLRLFISFREPEKTARDISDWLQDGNTPRPQAETTET